MKEQLRNSLIMSLYHMRLSRLYYTYFKLKGRPVTRIIVLHKINDLRMLEEKIVWLRKSCNVVSLNDYFIGKLSKEKINVCITFDDGYRSWLEAVPLLEQYEVPAIFFVSTEFLDCTDEKAGEAFCQKMGISYSPALSWDDAAYIASRPGMEIGSHTVSHPKLSSVDDDRLESELAESRHRIAEKVKRDVRYFAYPYGHYSAFNDKAARAVERSGYECGLTMVPGVNVNGRNRFVLYRDGIDETCPQPLFEAWMSGSYDLVKRGVDSARKMLGINL